MIEVMSQFSACVERASVDEAYVDITKEAEERLKSAVSRSVTIDQVPNTFVEGWREEEREENEEEDKEKRKEKGLPHHSSACQCLFSFTPVDLIKAVPVCLFSCVPISARRGCRYQ